MTGDVFELFDLWRRQATLAGNVAAMIPAVGFVMATRLTRMAAESGNPSAAGLRENQRMMSEKMSAMVEGGWAAGRVLGGLSRAASPTAAASVMVAAGEAAMKPAARTLKANARRLSRV